MKSPASTIKYLCMLLMIPIFLFSCEAEKKNNPHELIAGEDSKTWIASKEINIAGDKEKLSPAAEPQEIEFFNNGTFQLKKENQNYTGTWTYEGGNRELQLVFDEKPGLAEVFYVTRLEEDQLDLRAPDGGTLQLTAL